MPRAAPVPRNHVAKALWTPRFKPQQVPDKRKRLQGKRPTSKQLRAAANA
jgi:hypothetical protein